MKKKMIPLAAALALITAGCVIEIVETDHHGYDSYDLHSDQRSHRCGSCHATTVRVEISSPCWSCH